MRAISHVGQTRTTGRRRRLRAGESAAGSDAPDRLAACDAAEGKAMVLEDIGVTLPVL
jgi:hypothetical protein